MKRITTTIIICLCMLLLCGCGAGSEWIAAGDGGYADSGVQVVDKLCWGTEHG